MGNDTFFKNAKKRESKQSLLWSTRIHDYIRKHPTEYPSTLDDLLKICGVTIDWESVSNYQSFHAYLGKQRKKTDEAFKILVDDGWFNKYITDGLTEEQIYDKFIDVCLSWHLIPLYYDIDGKYKLIDLHSFILIKQERIRSTCKEISTKLNILQDHSTVLPRAVICGMQELKGTDNIKPLLDARNKLNEFLPEGETEDEE